MTLLFASKTESLKTLGVEDDLVTLPKSKIFVGGSLTMTPKPHRRRLKPAILSKYMHMFVSLSLPTVIIYIINLSRMS